MGLGLTQCTVMGLGLTQCTVTPLKVILDNKQFQGTLRYRREAAGEWTAMQGSFAMVHACNCAWIASDVRMAPGARVDDGLIHLVIVRPCTRMELLQMFLKAATGEHVSLPAVEVVACTEFVVTPVAGQRGL